MSTICLNMIVKNEAAIIADTLDNILEHIPIDYWVIADTGSTDDTVAIITDFFYKRGIAGQIVQHAWQDFGHNRQLALDAAQGLSDYSVTRSEEAQNRYSVNREKAWDQISILLGLDD